jgi:endonuclease YncB( thermonuclease family)
MKNTTSSMMIMGCCLSKGEELNESPRLEITLREQPLAVAVPAAVGASAVVLPVPNVDDINELLSIDITQRIRATTCKGTSCYVRVVDVYDGDTVTIASIEPGRASARFDKLRLYGIDTPEKVVRRNAPNRDLEKRAALIVTEWVRKQILGKIVYVKFYGEDKYGRKLGDIFQICTGPDGCQALEQSLNKLLVLMMYAVAYDGKTKKAFTEEALNLIVYKSTLPGYS